MKKEVGFFSWMLSKFKMCLSFVREHLKYHLTEKKQTSIVNSKALWYHEHNSYGVKLVNVGMTLLFVHYYTNSKCFIYLPFFQSVDSKMQKLNNFVNFSFILMMCTCVSRFEI